VRYLSLESLSKSEPALHPPNMPPRETEGEIGLSRPNDPPSPVLVWVSLGATSDSAPQAVQPLKAGGV